MKLFVVFFVMLILTSTSMAAGVEEKVNVDVNKLNPTMDTPEEAFPGESKDDVTDQEALTGPPEPIKPKTDAATNPALPKPPQPAPAPKEPADYGILDYEQKEKYEGDLDRTHKQIRVTTDHIDAFITNYSTQKSPNVTLQEVLTAQKAAQIKLLTNYEKMRSRSEVVKFLFGPNYKALDAVKEVNDATEVAAKELLGFQAEVTKTPRDSLLYKDMVQGMLNQHQAVLVEIAIENDSPSIFGWAVKFFR